MLIYKHNKWIRFILFSGFFLFTIPVKGEDVTDNDTSEPMSVSSKFNNFELNSQLASIYNFRGENVFKSNSQHDQHGVFYTSAGWSIFCTGIWLKYAGYYQVNGDNRSHMVNVGRGHEQNLFIGWRHNLTESFRLNSYFAYYFFPFAMEELTGVKNPSYLEPSLSMTYSPSGIIDLHLAFAYYFGIQERLSHKRYLYIRPSIKKSFDTDNEFVGFVMELGFGYKLYKDPSLIHDNIFDLQFSTSIPVNISKKLSISPMVSINWTNLYAVRPGDETSVWFSLAFGLSS